MEKAKPDHALSPAEQIKDHDYDPKKNLGKQALPSKAEESAITMEKQDILRSILSKDSAKVAEAKEAFKALLSARAQQFRQDSSKFIAKSLFESEQVDELSKSFLGKYVSYANYDAMNHSHDAARKENRGRGNPDSTVHPDEPDAGHSYRKAFKRRDGIHKALDRLTKEDTLSEEFKEGDEVDTKHIGRGVVHQVNGTELTVRVKNSDPRPGKGQMGHDSYQDHKLYKMPTSHAKKV